MIKYTVISIMMSYLVGCAIPATGLNAVPTLSGTAALNENTGSIIPLASIMLGWAVVVALVIFCVYKVTSALITKLGLAISSTNTDTERKGEAMKIEVSGKSELSHVVSMLQDPKIGSMVVEKRSVSGSPNPATEFNVRLVVDHPEVTVKDAQSRVS